MAYATPEQLAAALHIGPVTTNNEPLLTSCLEAAATEIDQAVDRYPGDPLPDPAPDLVVQVNVTRAVEWYKASDAAFGGVGSVTTGVIQTVPPVDGFARHAVTLVPYKQQWGVA